MDGIIFDVDGTLWDSTEPVAAAWDRAVRENSSLNLTLDAEAMGKVFGKTMTEIGDLLFPSLSPAERMNLLDICFSYENRYLEDHPGSAYPSVTETIRKLAEKYSLFIVSNCQLGYIELMMKSLEIGPYIKDHLCFGETLVPKGETILMLMERNGLKDPVYIGDTQGDADACAYAGIPFIFAEYGLGAVPKAETRIQRFEDLEKMFL